MGKLAVGRVSERMGARQDEYVGRRASRSGKTKRTDALARLARHEDDWRRRRNRCCARYGCRWVVEQDQNQDGKKLG